MSRTQCLVKWSLTVVAIFAMASPTIAQPGGGRGGPGGRGGFGGPGGGGVSGLLMSQDVRDELEISEEQLGDLRAMGEEMRDQMRSMFAGMRDLPPEERRERFESMRDQMQDVRAEAEERLGDILLPHQMERLREINVQQQVRRGGLGGALRGELGEELGITEDQREQLVTRAQELQQEMQEKIEKMRKDAQEELMGMLTSDQRSKLESMMGTEFDLPERGRGGFGGFGGGDRGPRGQRGQRGRGRPQAED